MRQLFSFLAMLGLALGTVAFIGCERDPGDHMENATENVEDAAEDTGDAVEDAVD